LQEINKKISTFLHILTTFSLERGRLSFCLKASKGDYRAEKEEKCTGNEGGAGKIKRSAIPAEK
jgi:hypothetical protein